MNIFFILFFIGIGFYFLASLSSIFFYINKKSNIISMILSLIASVVIASSALAEYIIYDFEESEFNIFGNLFNPLKMNIKIDAISTVFLMVISISSIIITIYIYNATIRGDINVAYNKSSFLANLFMIILSFTVIANHSYFLTLLISCAVVLIFIMLASDFENKEAANKATQYLILGNIAAILITIGYGLVLYESGMLTVNGFEAALVSYDMRNITFMMIMTGVVILLGVIPNTVYNHVRLLINGLFSKIILFILFRYVVNLFSGNISIICILSLLAVGIISVFYNSYKASLTIDGFKWLRYVDLALNSLCFISIIFSLYADNLGYGLIADQIRTSTLVMILCSIVLYPAITIIIHSLDKADKSKRFKLLAISIFIPKSLLPPIGGFAGIFIIISNISALLDLAQFSKTLLLLASVFGLVYVYLFYIYAHMKFFINVIDAGYEPVNTNTRRKISKINLSIISFSVVFTFITGFIPTIIGYGIAITYTREIIVLLISNIIIMLLLVYFLNSTQVGNTLKMLSPIEIKKAMGKDGIYHILLKAASFIFLLVGGTFYSISHNLILDGIKSYSILGVMYIIVSTFLLYNKDIDFHDLYLELFMMLVIVVDAVTPVNLLIKILMGILYMFFMGFAVYRQKLKIRDSYDRILSNGRIYLYIAFFLTFFANFNLSFGGFWSYVLYIVIGLILFVIVYIASSLIGIHVFKKKVLQRIIPSKIRGDSK